MERSPGLDHCYCGGGEVGWAGPLARARGGSGAMAPQPSGAEPQNRGVFPAFLSLPRGCPSGNDGLCASPTPGKVEKRRFFPPFSHFPTQSFIFYLTREGSGKRCPTSRVPRAVPQTFIFLLQSIFSIFAHNVTLIFPYQAFCVFSEAWFNLEIYLKILGLDV